MTEGGLDTNKILTGYEPGLEEAIKKFKNFDIFMVNNPHSKFVEGLKESSSRQKAAQNYG